MTILQTDDKNISDSQRLMYSPALVSPLHMRGDYPLYTDPVFSKRHKSHQRLCGKLRRELYESHILIGWGPGGCFTNSGGPSNQWQTILLCTKFVIRDLSVARSDGPSLLVKHLQDLPTLVPCRPLVTSRLRALPGASKHHGARQKARSALFLIWISYSR